MSKFKERLEVNKETKHRSHMEGFNINKLIQMKGREQYIAETSNRFAAFENLEVEVDNTSNTAWETIRDNIKISEKEYCRIVSHGSSEGCSKLLDQRKQA
jgi:hypothetical protein